MSTPMETNTENLRGILNAVNNLPESGGSDKCTPQLFGAVGDGTTDDSAAFNDWFEHLADNDVCGYIPNGTYLVKSGVGYAPTSPSDKRISFVGESADRTIIKADFADPTGKNVIAFQNCYIGEFGNLTIDNNETWANEFGITGLQMLDMQYTENVFSWIHDINIINVGRRAALIYSSGGPGHVAIKYVNMERVYAVGFTADRTMWGVHPADGKGINPTPVGIIVVDVSHFHFINCTARNFHYYPLEYKNYTEYCSHENCVIENCGQGIVLGQEISKTDPYAIGHKYYKAIGNVVKDVPVGIAAAHLGHCTFDNNTIIAENTGFALNSPCEYVTGAGNSCYVGGQAVQYRPSNNKDAEVRVHDNSIETALYNSKFSTPYYFAPGCQRCSVIVTNYQQTAKTRFVDANDNAYIPMLNTINTVSDSGYPLAGNYELIETIVCDGTYGNINRTKLSLKKANVFLNMKAASAATTVCVEAYNDAGLFGYAWIGNCINTGERFATAWFVSDGMNAYTEFTSPSSIKFNTGGVNRTVHPQNADTPINRLGFYTSPNENVFPAESTIEIWGVRA